MKPYFSGFNWETGVRVQPWTTASDNPNEKYYDFKRTPDAIPEALEDFKPWSRYESVTTFYHLLRWTNVDDPNFETNDCAFQGPHENSQKSEYPKELVCSGRLMFFFRDLDRNLSHESPVVWREFQRTGQIQRYQINNQIEWLANRSLQLLQELTNEPAWYCVAVELYPVFYSEAQTSEQDKFGYQVSFQFWAWGDDETETMDNFGVAVQTMQQCLKLLSVELNQPQADGEITHTEASLPQ